MRFTSLLLSYIHVTRTHTHTVASWGLPLYFWVTYTWHAHTHTHTHTRSPHEVYLFTSELYTCDTYQPLKTSDKLPEQKVRSLFTVWDEVLSSTTSVYTWTEPFTVAWLESEIKWWVRWYDYDIFINFKCKKKKKGREISGCLKCYIFFVLNQSCYCKFLMTSTVCVSVEFPVMWDCRNKPFCGQKDGGVRISRTHSLTETLT